MASPRVLILFGTETGNAQDVAAAIAREARLLLFKPALFAMDAYDVTRLPEEKIVICVASTTGQGDHPSNMKKFWRFLLRKTLPPDSLSHVQCAVFGLGDSGYLKYNVVAKKLYNRLVSLGANALIDVGLGDDQHPTGYESALDKWLPQLWQNLNKSLGFPSAESLAAIQEEGAKLQLGDPKFNVNFLPATSTPAGANSIDPESNWASEAIAAAASFRAVWQLAAGLPPVDAPPPVPSTPPPPHQDPTPPYAPWRPYMSRMMVNRRITSPDHFQDTRHIEFDLGDSSLTYEPGDVMAIFPRTPKDVVEGVLKRFGWEGDAEVEITAADPPMVCDSSPVTRCKLRALLQGVLDLAGVSPRRYFFQVLSHFTNSQMELERLQYFSSAEGRDDLYRYNNKERRSVWEVLSDFKDSSPPLHWLLECCPLLQPRYFSISSSPLAHRGQAHITLAVVKWVTPTRRDRQGLCSSWLAGIDPSQGDTRVPVWIEKGTLRLQGADNVPLLMVGPGTGVAPFRSFIQHRHATLPPTSRPHPAPSILVFGCRSQHQDFYYHEEWPHYQNSGVLHPTHGLLLAFSRDQPNKVYVTHRIREYAREIWELLQQGAIVLVSGLADKMPADVRDAMCDVVASQAGVSKLHADKFLQRLEVAKRYQVEAWS